MAYTDSEIREELARLGYTNVSEDHLRVFKLNLMKLILSDKSKKSTMESGYSSEETGGNISNHGNQWLDSSSDYSGSWMYGDRGTSYSLPGSEVSPVSSTGHGYRTGYSQPDVGGPVSGSPIFYSDPHMTSLRSASSEPNVRPKSVKWSLARDSVKIIPADETRQLRADIRENSRDEEGDNQIEQDDYDEYQRPASTDLEAFDGYRGLPRKIPGIITRKEHPHTRNLVRTKPFERHQMYMRVWKARPPVGEASRSSVCRQVHNKLLRKEDVVKQAPPKTLTPNPYVVPTDKPRYELRWAIRQCNENYEMPPCGFFHES